MKARLLNIWDRFRTGFWFVPLLFVMAAIVLAFGIPMLDSRTDGWIVERVPWLSTTTAAARSSLAAIGGAMVTVTGVVFSITVVALSIESSQFGSRILRNFTDDRVTQAAIGMFVGTSVYCFLVMRSVRELDGTPFVPHVSVAVGVVLAIVSIAVLVFFIHHVAQAIQAPQIVDSLGYDLDGAIDRLFPEKIGAPGNDDQDSQTGAQQADKLPEGFGEVIADRQGYIQAIDGEGLIDAAQNHDVVFELLKRPGDFLAKGGKVARVWPAGKHSEEVAAELNSAIIVGIRRTPRQDIGCTVDEMVEVAVRALSPGINDPFTAINCIDRLSASLVRLADRRIPSAYRCDEDGKLRLIARPIHFSDVLDASFRDIRRYGRSSISVSMRLLDALMLVLERTLQPDDQEAVLRQAELILKGCEMEDHQACDIATLQERCRRLRLMTDQTAVANGIDECQASGIPNRTTHEPGLIDQ